MDHQRRVAVGRDSLPGASSSDPMSQQSAADQLGFTAMAGAYQSPLGAIVAVSCEECSGT
jgi:hypothetical protein